MNMGVYNSILALPLRVVLQAHERLTGHANGISKTDAARWLAKEVESGRLTVAQIRTGSAAIPQAAPQSAPVLPPAAPNNPRLDAVAQSAARAESAAIDLSTKLGTLGSEVAGMAATLRSTVNAGTVDSGRITTLESAASRMAGDLASVLQEVKGLRTASKLSPEEVAEEVRSAVASAIAPIVAAAQAAPEVAAQVAAVTAGPVSRLPALDVFGIDARDARGNPLEFEVWGCPDAPPIDPCFVWTEEVLRALFLMQETGRNAWLGGPAGTGKTQTIQQFAARTGRMFRRFVFDRLATREDYLGAVGLASGSTVFQPGPVLEVYQTPGAVCLLDELGMGNPSALSALNGWLEPGARMAYADRAWTKATGVLFAAADNSLTQGDPSGRFAGVGQMNTALADRFAFVVPFVYLDAALESQAIQAHAKCSKTLADHVVAALKVCRSKVDSGEVIDAPSIRQAVAFVQACRVLPVDQAWQITIAARQPAESSVGIAAVFAACINAALIEKEI